MFFQLLDECDTLLPIIRLIKYVINIIQIGIPIILILMGSIDLGKAVLSSDDKEIKGAVSKLVKRAIAAVAVFFVATLVKLLMGWIGSSYDTGESDTGTWLTCWNKAKIS